MWAAAGILSGWLGDKYGPAWIGCATILLSLPWYGLVAIEGSLAMFLTFFALEGKHNPNPSIWSCPLTIVNPLVFFASGLNPPVMLELSSVSRTIEGVGCMTFILSVPVNRETDTPDKMLMFMGLSTSRLESERQVSVPSI